MSIPDTMLDRAGLSGHVELEARAGVSIVRGVADPCAGWDEAFRDMSERRDDALLDPWEPASDWDTREWGW
ncbi:MAG: AbrB/MazE/SpoVT family DNA-binding domain-containing protein [Bacteroidota bacterium]